MADMAVGKILVVDDEHRIRDACRMVLREAGFDVDCVEDGSKGLEMIDRSHYDVVLLDLMMPMVSGFEVLEKIKALHPDTAVIVITGYSTLEHSIEAMKKGAFDFIPKPFTPEHLRVTVSKALSYTQALQDIAESRSRIRTLVNRLSDGVLCTDVHHKVVLANPAFLRMIDYLGENVLGRDIGEFLEILRITEMIHQTLDMAEEEFGELTAVVEKLGRAEGEETVLEVRCCPFRNRAGTNVGVITVLHDITALKKMDRMKSDFVSTVSHEIRGPMNSVLMQLQVVLDGLAGDLTRRQKEILERAGEKIRNLVAMASELLDLARIESGLIAQEREVLDLVEINRDQVTFHQARAESKSIRLSLDAPAALPPVLANRRNMEEVLSNLITNAITYTPSGGEVHVSLDSDGAFVRIRVRDTGMGIDAEDLPRLFQRFYRVRNERTRHIHGTGLGLAIVKGIVEAHQGRIDVSSEAGKGSVFTVHIPVAAL